MSLEDIVVSTSTQAHKTNTTYFTCVGVGKAGLTEAESRIVSQGLEAGKEEMLVKGEHILVGKRKF